MIKKTTKKVLKEVEEVESEVIVCDVCDKELQYAQTEFVSPVAVYYKITTGHHDWFNDSCDSINHKDACCDECLLKFTQEWFQNAEVIESNTAYIEIHKARHWKREASKEVKE